MEITFDDFCNRVKEDTEKTASKYEQYKAVVKYFNDLHEAGSTVPVNEAFTDFQKGVLLFLNEKFEKYSVKDLNELFKTRSSDSRYGYNYARKASK